MVILHTHKKKKWNTTTPYDPNDSTFNCDPYFQYTLVRNYLTSISAIMPNRQKTNLTNYNIFRANSMRQLHVKMTQAETGQ